MALICRIFTCLRGSTLVHIPKRNTSSSDVLYSLIRRGLVKQIFPPEQQMNFPGSPSAYAGFDATSDSLHVGNLLVLVSLLHWQRAGYKTIVVIGDATAEIGDPSGHKSDRSILSRDVIFKNCDSIEKNLIELFDNHERFIYPKGKSKGKLGELCIFRNSEWYKNLNIVDFISQAGKHVRVGDMLSRTSVKSRMESGAGINFSEFSYQIFQSYDWLHLFQKYNCRFQFGGSDQLGNITSGHSLIDGSQYQHVYGALLPLIQSESGDKFGKSAGNAVYLSSHRTSPFDLYQFFMRLPDAEVSKFLRYLTFLEVEEIEDIVQSHIKNPDLRNGQKRLAEEVTLLVHGAKGLNFAENATQILYHSNIAALAQLTTEEVNKVFPLSTVSRVPFEHGITIYDLTLKMKCFANKDDAHRIIRGGGVYLNFERITTPEYVIVPDLHILPNGITLIRIGKKTYYVVSWK